MTDIKELRVMTEVSLDALISDDHFREALTAACKKRDWIISREGDLDGARRQDWYLVELTVEYVHDRILSEICMLRTMALAWEKAPACQQMRPLK